MSKLHIALTWQKVKADRYINRQSSQKALPVRSTTGPQQIHAVVAYPEPYVQPLILKALQKYGNFEVLESVGRLPTPESPLLQFTAYETLDFDHATEHPRTSLMCAYVIRKALIRKHYLSNTVATWLVKHPDSVLANHFKPCVHFELDYAEFLDEALVDAWDLNESMERNENGEPDSQPEWWILKPGMSDGGNGIRLFSSMEQLQAIFEEWEGDSDNETDTNSEDQALESNPTESNAAMTSQLRHFIAQPYIDPPLLLPSYGNRKFHIRTYVVAVGALKVFVYRDMLALFAAKAYMQPSMQEDGSGMDLTQHLTNTCFQDETTRGGSVFQFWSIKEPHLAQGWQRTLFQRISDITGEIFEAAAKEQMVHFQAIPNAFEVFGVDFLVDAELRVWLLELNAYPDFKQTGADLQDAVVGGLFEEVTKVAINPFFGNVQDVRGTERLVLVKDIDLGRR